MEIIGFILFLIGAGSMDSEGNWFYVAACCMVFGFFLMYLGEEIKDRAKRKRRCRNYKEEM